MDRFGIRHWYDLLPEVVLVGGLVFFLIDETDAATSSFESGRALLVIAAIAVGWLAARLVLARFVPWLLARAGLMGAGALGILALIVLPAYDDDTVVEVFPASPPTTAPTRSDAAAVEPAVAGEPVAVRRGTFQGIDHRAEGSVVVYRQPDGSFVVGLEDIDIQPGPDYDLYLVPGADRDDKDDGVNLGDLKGNKGTQFYDVPSATDVEDGEWTVLVWCVTFGVPIANATPTA